MTNRKDTKVRAKNLVLEMKGTLDRKDYGLQIPVELGVVARGCRRILVRLKEAVSRLCL